MRISKAFDDRLNVADIQSKAMSSMGAVSNIFGLYDMDRNLVKCFEYQGGELTQVESDSPTVTMPLLLEPLLKKKPCITLFGGRGSSKTRSVVGYLIEMARSSRQRILCCREIQGSIADSSKQELEDEIVRQGVQDEFRITDREIEHLTSGSTFLFEGLYRNLTKIKGKAGITICWIEEAENVSQMSWDVLDPTIRAEGSQMIVTFNPKQPEDPIYKELVTPYKDKMVNNVYEDDDTCLIKINYTENPWWTQTLERKKEKMRKNDFDRYLWVYEGEFLSITNEQVLGGKWTVEEFDIDDFGDKVAGTRFLPDGPYYGADWGFAQDPTTLVRCWIWDNKLYIDYEAGGVGIEIEDTPELFTRIPDAQNYVIRADCARPETISHVANKGFKIEGATKWSGSVEDGVAYLRSFDSIVIHPRCKNVIHEAKNYKHKTDRLTGDILPDIVDKDNHFMDALRYALQPMIQSGTGLDWL